MTRGKGLAGAMVVSLGIAAGLAGVAAPARAQIVYQCPLGYYYYPDYGCVPQNYFYGQPYYFEPGFGFGFFFGGPRGGSRGHFEPPHHATPHPGGAPHGGRDGRH